MGKFLYTYWKKKNQTTESSQLEDLVFAILEKAQKTRMDGWYIH